MNRAFTNVLSVDPNRTAEFYERLLDMKRHYNSEWFIILTHPGVAGFEFGILDREHDVVPGVCRAAPSGVILTFVVEDLGPIVARARQIGADIIQEPTLMPYGQTRLLLRDPDGAIVDISSPDLPARG